MFGMFCVVISVGLWLALATYLSLPVSTTHTAVGGVIGVAIVARGWDAVHWDQVGLIAVSWVASPVLSGICSMALYACVRSTVLRKADSSARALLILPVLVTLTVLVSTMFLIYKGLPVFPEVKKTPIGIGIAISIGIGAAAGLGTFFGCVPWLRRSLAAKTFADENTEDADVETGKGGVPSKSTSSKVEMVEIADTEAPTASAGAASPTAVSPKVESKSFDSEPSSPKALVKSADSKAAFEDAATKKGFFATLTSGVDIDIHAEIEGRAEPAEADSANAKRVREMHASAEKFSERAEHTFTYLQVFTACLDALAHGANDTANSLGPFAAVYGIYVSGVASSKSPVPIWILLISAAGIVFGLLFFGYKIIKAIGAEMTKITPSRGFAIELGAATIIIIGSLLGIPLSTTHCQVGSTVGLGLLEKDRSKAVNWTKLLQISAAWVITLIVAALCSGGIYAFSVNAPSTYLPVLVNTTSA
jgi:sodium-dependent phosphate transporter